MIYYKDLHDVFTGMVIIMRVYAIMIKEMEKAKIIIMMAVTMKVILRIIIIMVKELNSVVMEIFWNKVFG